MARQGSLGTPRERIRRLPEAIRGHRKPHKNAQGLRRPPRATRDNQTRLPSLDESNSAPKPQKNEHPERDCTNPSVGDITDCLARPYWLPTTVGDEWWPSMALHGLRWPSNIACGVRCVPFPPFPRSRRTSQVGVSAARVPQSSRRSWSPGACATRLRQEGRPHHRSHPSPVPQRLLAEARTSCASVLRKAIGPVGGAIVAHASSRSAYVDPELQVPSKRPAMGQSSADFPCCSR